MLLAALPLRLIRSPGLLEANVVWLTLDELPIPSLDVGVPVWDG